MKVFHIKNVNKIPSSQGELEQTIRERGLIVVSGSRLKDLMGVWFKYSGLVANREWRRGLVMVINLKLKLERLPSESLPWKVDDLGSEVKIKGDGMPELKEVLAMFERGTLPLPLSPRRTEYGSVHELSVRVVIQYLSGVGFHDYDIDWEDEDVKCVVLSGASGKC